MRTSLIVIVFSMLSSYAFAHSFLSEQMKFARPRAALESKGDIIQEKLAGLGLKTNDLNIIIVAYKADRILEIYAKKASAARYEMLSSYAICNTSGVLGPKRALGDYQVPEGFYYIDRFNPASNYHLSLGINYPNRSDRMKSRASKPGGDIFIHGSCVTIGCLPMTDDKIKEIYLYAVYAKNSGQGRIPVYIFPFRMDGTQVEKYAAHYRDRPELLTFWKQIKTGYDKFEQDKRELIFSVDKNGNYHF